MSRTVTTIYDRDLHAKDQEVLAAQNRALDAAHRGAWGTAGREALAAEVARAEYVLMRAEQQLEDAKDRDQSAEAGDLVADAQADLRDARRADPHGAIDRLVARQKAAKENE